MTDKTMLEALGEAELACTNADGHAPLSDTELELRFFIRRHAAEIRQNAIDSLRLKALEKAMGEFGAWECSKITKRADEIMQREMGVAG